MILLTGAAGLLGREVAAQLRAARQPVRGLDLLPANTCDEHVVADLRDAEACQRACTNIATVIHAAARQHHDAPRIGRASYFSANVEITRNLVAAAIRAGVRRIVYVSSDMVYGMPPGRALRESDTPRPIGPYGESKLAGEAICLAARDRGLSVVVLRPRLIVGPGRLGVLGKLFACVRAGRRIPLLGNGHNRYQMVAVADVASACVLAARSGVQGVFNLGSDEPPPIRALLGELCRRAGVAPRFLPLPAPLANAALWSLHSVGLAPLVPEQFRIASVDYVLDTTAARRDLGWTPQHRDADMLWAAYETAFHRRA